MKHLVISLAAVLAAISVQAASDPYMAELTQLTDARDEAVASEVRKIDTVYSQKLQVLLQRATKAGNLDSAVAIRSKIQALQNGLPSPGLVCDKLDASNDASATGPAGELVKCGWKRVGADGVLVYDPSGTVFFYENREFSTVGTWTTEDKRIIHKWRNGATSEITISNDRWHAKPLLNRPLIEDAIDQSKPRSAVKLDTLPAVPR